MSDFDDNAATTAKSLADRRRIAGSINADRNPIGGRSRSTRASTTNNPLSRADGRTAQGRRVRDLFKAFSETLGNPDDTGTKALILSAAELIVAAENARRDLLTGHFALNEVVRVENLAARALRRLGLDKPLRQPRKSFAEKMAEAEAARKAAEAHAAADASPGPDTAAASDQRAGDASSQCEGVIA